MRLGSIWPVSATIGIAPDGDHSSAPYGTLSALVFESGWVPLMGPKRWLLRIFGATIGDGLIIKPDVWIKYPWRLAVGDHCWIGKGTCIDNLADVRLGSHVCMSQQAYVCTGATTIISPRST